MLRLSISKIRYRKEPEILYEISRKNQKKICLIVACLLSLVLTTVIMERRMEVVRAQMDDTQQALAKEVFRFHVIAESDSEKDQNIKLYVRRGGPNEKEGLEMMKNFLEKNDIYGSVHGSDVVLTTVVDEALEYVDV